MVHKDQGQTLIHLLQSVRSVPEVQDSHQALKLQQQQRQTATASPFQESFIKHSYLLLLF